MVVVAQPIGVGIVLGTHHVVCYRVVLVVTLGPVIKILGVAGFAERGGNGADVAQPFP